MSSGAPSINMKHFRSTIQFTTVPENVALEIKLCQSPKLNIDQP